MGTISNALLYTLIFVFFLLPGFIYIQGFYYSKRGTLNSTNFYSHLLWGTLVSLILYCISYKVCVKFGVVDISLDDIFSVLLSSQKNETTDAADTVNHGANIFRIKKMTSFILITDVLSVLLLFLTKVVVIMFKLDAYSPSLRFSNPWLYVLTGRKSERDSLGYKDYIVEAHLMCEIGKSVVVYKGKVIDFRLKDETLDYVCLTSLQRTGITDWEEVNKKSVSKAVSPTLFGDVLKSEYSTFFNGIIYEKNNILSVNNDRTLDQINLDPKFYKFPGSVLFRACDIINIYYLKLEVNAEDSKDAEEEKIKLYLASKANEALTSQSTD